MGEISVKTGNNARNGGKNSLNRLIRCVCGKKIGPDPRNFNQRVSLGRNDLLIRTFPKTLRYRSMLRAEHIRVFADSHVKHGSHAIVADRSIQELTRDVDFFEADAVIATGQRTGDSATMAEIDEIRAATELPLLVGSGVTPANVKQILGRTQGVIVASTMKVDGVWWNDVELARVKHFMSVAQAALEEA
ncbi:hypothetical protein HC617_22545 [Escherichia coli]|nr:hypothetical protein [Escherichia coli]HAJ6962262.1 hypothetical protein [Escherichia coli]